MSELQEKTGRKWRLSRGTWHTVEVEHVGVTLELRKPRQSERLEVGAKTPTWARAMALVYAVAAGREVEDEDIRVPAHEMEALSAFLADITLSISGAEDEDGAPLEWGALTRQERRLVWEQLPLGSVQTIWGEVTTKAATEDDPDLVLRIAEQYGDEEE